MSQWQELNHRYTALSLREKVLILATSLVLILFILGSFIAEPQFKALQASKKVTGSIQKNIQDTIAGRIAIEQKIASDPAGQLKVVLQDLTDANKKLSQTLAMQKMSLISSNEMAEQLQYLVAEQTNLTVESLKSLAPQAVLFEQSTQSQQQPQPLLFRHGIEIQVKGRYFDIVRFLQKIEQQNEFLLWGDIHYEVIKYPDALVTFVVSTVSTDKEFIGVK